MFTLSFAITPFRLIGAACIGLLFVAWIPIDEDIGTENCPRPANKCPRADECKLSDGELHRILADHVEWLKMWDEAENEWWAGAESSGQG
jgi:hypothetical protein